jgi:hypothetical protein
VVERECIDQQWTCAFACRAVLSREARLPPQWRTQDARRRAPRAEALNLASITSGCVSVPLGHAGVGAADHEIQGMDPAEIASHDSPGVNSTS